MSRGEGHATLPSLRLSFFPFPAKKSYNNDNIKTFIACHGDNVSLHKIIPGKNVTGIPFSIINNSIKRMDKKERKKYTPSSSRGILNSVV